MQLKYPFIPLKNIVLFPGVVIPVFVGRKKSIQAIEEAKAHGNKAVFCLQKVVVEDPTIKDIHEIGVLAEIAQVTKVNAKTYKILLSAVSKIQTRKITDSKNIMHAEVVKISEENDVFEEKMELIREINDKLEEYLTLNKNIPAEIIKEIIKQKDLLKLVNILTHFFMFSVIDKQHILEMNSVKNKADFLLDLLAKEIDIIKVENKLHSTVRDKIEKSQKEFYLKEKIKAIKAELGEQQDFDEIEDYENRINLAGIKEDAKEHALRELGKLKKLSNLSSEAGVIKTYLEWLIDLPWDKIQQKEYDIKEIVSKLDMKHYGLKKVKERIVEFLAVYKLTQNVQSTILCLAGPSGVGKTSIVKSIAQVMGRQFIKISLGGLNDEAELRGHRRTYVGAMPGRIVQALRNAKVKNPVILLDEIDKMSKNFQSNPSAVLLEILDKEQNKAFYDYYLEAPFDLSEVLFIATANNVQDITGPLLDRMEVITLTGYELEEKVVIAEKYLLPRVIKAHGLKEGDIVISSEVLREIILSYTREAGLRELERCLATLARKAALSLLTEEKTLNIEASQLYDLLGVKKYKTNIVPHFPAVGIALGLAYTASGGEVMPVEVSVFPGKGMLRLTGKMGDVMQESSQTALSYVRLISEEIGLKKDFYEKNDVHIHIPENAIPKDGPSAGVTITLAIISAFTGIAVRNDIAMTGEITLYGNVLPVGGVKEKLLATERYAIGQIFVPQENMMDVNEAKKSFKQQLNVTGVSQVKEIIKLGLVKNPFTVSKKWLDKG